MHDDPVDDEPDYYTVAEWRRFESRLAILLKGVRQVLIMLLGFTEDFLGMRRSIEPRRKRDTF